MNTKLHAKVDGESINVDPQLHFQLLLTAAGDMPESIVDILRYELCNIPSSLFEQAGFPRAANINKPALADAIWTEENGKDMTAPLTSEDIHFAIDGGSLLYQLPLAKGSTFAFVCKMYVDYVKKFKQPTIVF